MPSSVKRSLRCDLSTPPLKRRGVLIRSLSIRFRFEIIASQFGTSSGGASTGRASCSCGTCPLIRQASPAADVDCSHFVAVSHPSAVSTHIRAIMCLVVRATCWALLRGVGRVDLLYLDTQPCG